MKIKHIFFLLISAANIMADNNLSIIDKTHSNISQKVISTSQYIDNSINEWLEDDNKTTVLKKEVNNVDTFYKNEKFIDETNESFLRVRVLANYQRLEEENYNVKLRAYLSLSKTKQNIKLFIEDVNQDNLKELPFKSSTSDDTAMAVGISYFTLAFHNIDSKYSLGIRGLYPYTKVRYKKVFNYEDWLIEPSQSFTYSSKTNFKEETKLYFDKKLNELNLFRIELARSTESQEAGMDYYLALQYFYQPKEDIGIKFTQSFSGNTKYSYLESEFLNTYNGINTYNTEISWRQNIWKKWFFYELRPGIDFQKVNNFKVNYKILFLTDFYFGYNQ